MHQIVVNGLIVDVIRKDIKNLHLAVYPPNGRVRVAVPLRVDDEAVRLAIVSKWSWIKRQQLKFAQQERQSEREYVSGESHYYRGSRYLLNVIYHDSAPKVILRSNARIDLYVRLGSDTEQRARVMLAWYRKQLRAAVPPLIAKWETVLGVQTAEWGIKRMKTKWGTCNIEARRIWLNLDLIKKPERCLEYIIVHELVHLLERHHNDRFTGLLDKALPSWRFVREELNREPLAHENWD